MLECIVFKLVDKNVQVNWLFFGDIYMVQCGGVGSYFFYFYGFDGLYGLGVNVKEEIYYFCCELDIEGDIFFVL